MISIIINVDTRPGVMGEHTTAELMLEGTRSLDFLIEGVINKKQFFLGHKHDVTLFIDYHERLPRHYEDTLLHMLNIGHITNLVFNRHTTYFEERPHFDKWNDLNFLNAVMMGRGEYIAHFDGDTMAFRDPSCDAVQQMLQILEQGNDYVSYPSPCSPGPDTNPHKDWDYWWASTRFFMCKREVIDYTEIVKCLKSSDYLFGKYGDRKQRCPWLEHILGIIAYSKGQRVYYPPFEQNYMVFSWGRYYAGVLEKLNQMPYAEVVDYVNKSGGISWPCDVMGVKI